MNTTFNGFAYPLPLCALHQTQTSCEDRTFMNMDDTYRLKTPSTPKKRATPVGDVDEEQRIPKMPKLNTDDSCDGLTRDIEFHATRPDYDIELTEGTLRRVPSKNSRTNTNPDTARARMHIQTYYHDTTERKVYLNTFTKHIFLYERGAIDEVLDHPEHGISRIADSKPSNYSYLTEDRRGRIHIPRKNDAASLRQQQSIYDPKRGEHARVHINLIRDKIYHIGLRFGSEVNLDPELMERLAVSCLKRGIQDGIKQRSRR